VNFLSKLSYQILLVAAFINLQEVSAAAEDPILETFKLTCLSNGTSFEQLQNMLLVSAWEDRTATPPSELAGLARFLDAAKNKMQTNYGFDQVAILSGKVSGRQLYAWLASHHTADKNLVSCALYDFDGTLEQFSAIDLAEYSDQTPEKKETSGSIILRWPNPSKLDGYYLIKKTYAPKDSKADELAGIHGISLQTTAQKED
jgi:hypothetical protein